MELCGRGGLGGSGRGWGVEDEADKRVAAVGFRAGANLKGAGQMEAAGAPRREAWACVGDDYVGGAGRGVVDRTKPLRLDDNRPSGETE